MSLDSKHLPYFFVTKKDAWRYNGNYKEYDRLNFIDMILFGTVFIQAYDYG